MKKDELCEDIKANDWNYCHNLTLENCSSNDSKICDKRCKWVRCNYLVNQQANNFSQCVPSYLPAKNESNEICITNVGKMNFFYFFWKKLNQKRLKTLRFQSKHYKIY